MSRHGPYQRELKNLAGKIKVLPGGHRRDFMPKEEALQSLREQTGRDFGYDVAAWKRSLKENGRM